jgi:hypothetical protein
MSNPWDQQPKESSKAFQAFITYRDMGLKRSCQKVATELKKSLSAIHELSKRHNWQERVTAWDAHVDKQTQSQQLELVKAMKARQINLALKAQKTASKGLKILLDSYTAKKDSKGGHGSNISSNALRPDGLSKLLEMGCRIERLNRDEPEQNVEVLGSQSFDNLTVEEQEKFHQLLEKIGATHE